MSDNFLPLAGSKNQKWNFLALSLWQKVKPKMKFLSHLPLAGSNQKWKTRLATSLNDNWSGLRCYGLMIIEEIKYSKIEILLIRKRDNEKSSIFFVQRKRKYFSLSSFWLNSMPSKTYLKFYWMLSEIATRLTLNDDWRGKCRMKFFSFWEFRHKI